MKATLKASVIFLAVAIGGYMLIALLQTLVLEVALGGQVRTEAPLGVLAAGTVGTVISGLIGGFAAARVDRARAARHVAGVVGMLVLDTTYVIANGIGGEPAWFSLGGALTLMAATVAGGWLAARGR